MWTMYTVYDYEELIALAPPGVADSFIWIQKEGEIVYYFDKCNSIFAQLSNRPPEHRRAYATMIFERGFLIQSPFEEILYKNLAEVKSYFQSLKTKKAPTCDCGAAAVNSSRHSYWCSVAELENLAYV